MIRILKIFGLTLSIFVCCIVAIAGLTYVIEHIKYGLCIIVLIIMFIFCSAIANDIIKKHDKKRN